MNVVVKNSTPPVTGTRPSSFTYMEPRIVTAPDNYGHFTSGDVVMAVDQGKGDTLLINLSRGTSHRLDFPGGHPGLHGRPLYQGETVVLSKS